MDREAFRTEVTTAMVGNLSQIETFLAPVGGRDESLTALKQRLHVAADAYATMLQEPDTAEQAAISLVHALFGSVGDPPVDWWKTEAGQAVAHAIGYHRERAYRADVQAILGISRQRVHELIAKDVLVEDNLGITAESIRARVRSQRAM
jgi:hypothetical protein